MFPLGYADQMNPSDATDGRDGGDGSEATTQKTATSNRSFPSGTLVDRIEVDHRILSELLREASRETPTLGVRQRAAQVFCSAAERHLRAVGSVLGPLTEADALEPDHERFLDAIGKMDVAFDGQDAAGLRDVTAALQAHIDEEQRVLADLAVRMKEADLVRLAFEYGAQVDQASGL
jgi:hypothetical protein